MLAARIQGRLNGPQEFLAERAAVFRQRRDLVVDRLNMCAGLTCRRPEGAFYVFASCAGTIGKKTPSGDTIETDLDFAAFLLAEAQVAVVPGTAFGLAPYFRVSYATSTEALEEACDRIEAACAKLV